MDPNADTLQRLPDHYHAPMLHAGFWRRAAAWVIDALVMVVPILLIEFAFLGSVFLSAVHARHPAFPVGRILSVYALLVIVPWLYYALCESSRWQATLGKRALGLRVTDEFGRRIGFGRASGRHFGKIVSGMIMDIGYMLAGWTARKQALHDLVAGCCVVQADGLARWQRGEVEALPGGHGGMSGTAIALIVIGACCLFLLPVLGILAAIAIPAYQAYSVRAQVSEGLLLSQDAREAVTHYMAKHGVVPSGNAAVGLPGPAAINGRYVASVEVREGQVVVTYGPNANAAIRGEHLVLVPQGSLHALNWKCRSPDIREKFLPGTCRE